MKFLEALEEIRGLGEKHLLEKLLGGLDSKTVFE
jgi:hypothetical protein